MANRYSFSVPGAPSPFLPSLNYAGSADRRMAFTSANMPRTLKTPDYGVVDSATGRVVSVQTGQPWTGVEPRTGKQYAGGVLVPSNTVPNINPNDPNQRYKPVDIVKSPDVAAATSGLMESFKKTADESLEDFNANLKAATAARDQAFTSARNAADLTGFEAATRGAQSRYSGALDQSMSDYAALNAANEAALRGIEDEARGILPRYNQAAADIGARQEAELRKQISRYKAASGTPTSLGSAEQRMLLRGIQDVQLPLKQAEIAREYDLLNNLSLPIQREIAARETSRIASFNPMAAGQQYSSLTDTERTIQTLRQQTANMSMAQADAYLRSLQLPVKIRQAVLAQNIAALGGIAALEEGSRYRGLQDVMGVNVSQPEYFDLGLPEYPSSRYAVPNPRPAISPTVAPIASRYYETAAAPSAATRAAVTASLGTPVSRYPATVPTAQVPSYVTAGGPSAGGMSDAVYDPTYGVIRNRYTGEILQEIG